MSSTAEATVDDAVSGPLSEDDVHHVPTRSLPTNKKFGMTFPLFFFVASLGERSEWFRRRCCDLAAIAVHHPVISSTSAP